MNIDGCGDTMVPKGLTDHGSDGKVGDVVVVHNVEVHDVCTCLQDIINLLAELGEVSRKDRRSDEVVLIAPNVERSRRRPGDLLGLYDQITSEQHEEKGQKLKNNQIGTKNVGLHVLYRDIQESTHSEKERTAVNALAPERAAATVRRANFILPKLDVM